MRGTHSSSKRDFYSVLLHPPYIRYNYAKPEVRANAQSGWLGKYIITNIILFALLYHLCSVVYASHKVIHEAILYQNNKLIYFSFARQ